ncbi:MAG TPA: hypothetical protein PLB63_09840 [Planctomycetota bacterium]|nr:hypothetical protein [Planctomycetota bacterium]HQB01239.1 hypothetical protein [Planctomycetota bacterium]
MYHILSKLFKLFIFIYYLSPLYASSDHWVNLLSPYYRTKPIFMTEGELSHLNLLWDSNYTTGFASRSDKLPFLILFQFSRPDTVLTELHIDFQPTDDIPCPTKINFFASKTMQEEDFFHIGSLNINPRKAHHKLSCKPTEVSFLLLQVEDSTNHKSFHLTELEFLGYHTKEKYNYPTTYKASLKVLQRLCKILNKPKLVIPRERQLFKDILSNTTEYSMSLEEIALLASGVTSTTARKKYIAKFNHLYHSMKLEKLSPYEKAKKIFDYIRKDYLKKFTYQATSIEEIFNKGEYACVTGSLFYNLLAKRAGLDIYAVEVYGHTFSTLYIDDKQWDIELTSQHGFAPKNQKDIDKILRDQARYIPIEESEKREERTILEQIGMLYYNCAGVVEREKKYDEKLINLYKSLVLNHRFARSIKFTIQEIVISSEEYAKKKLFNKSLQLLKLAFHIMPKDKQLQEDYQNIYSQWIAHLKKQNQKINFQKLKKRIQKDKYVSSEFKKTMI